MPTISRKNFFIPVFFLLAIGMLVACASPTESPRVRTTNENSIDEVSSEGDNLNDLESSNSNEIQETEATNDKDDEMEVNPSVAVGNGLAIQGESIEIDDNGIMVGFTKDGHAFRGNPEAPIIIKEYSDFQCPFCERFINETYTELEDKSIAENEIVLVFYDFPLDNIHPQASAAANAARCAGEQGALAFWAMHDRLFLEPKQWSIQTPEDVFITYANDLQLDAEMFESCVMGKKYDSDIRADLASGSKLGVTGTPTFFLNDQILVGAQPIAIFENAISIVNNGGQFANNEPQPAQPPAAPTPAAINDQFAGAMGDPNAPVTIVEFTDYQCPYCSQHSTVTMPEIVREFVDTGRVYYVLKDLPLDQLHPDARSAAAAARCAGDQEAYWEMHDALFADQSRWAGSGSQINQKLSELAQEIGLDSQAFLTCLEEGRFDDSVEDNVSEARSLGVNGTPFFFVDGYPLNGARPIEHFQIAVELAEQGRLAEAFTPQPQQEPQEPVEPVDVPIADAFSIGDSDAPITIVEYTDYQCPYCQRHFQETYPLIMKNYVDKGIVRYVFKDFPLNSIHPQAAEAAEAARCAAEQDAFLEMHDLLFERQSEWSGTAPTDIFIEFSQELNLDQDIFTECLTSGKYTSAIDNDLQEGLGFGVNGTPAFFINGYAVSGAQPYSLFEQAIDSLLARSE